MANRGYKKYMKKDVRKGNPFLKIFIISFFGMLLFFTFIFNVISKRVTVDTSIGEYKEQSVEEIEGKKIVDVNRLEMIQSEDQGRDFSSLMKNSEDEKNDNNAALYDQQPTNIQEDNPTATPPTDVVYKVFIGSYTSAEQAKVAKEIIMESGAGFNPIVKCLGNNDYTLQVGSFKSKQSADAMLISIQNSNLPGRIVKE